MHASRSILTGAWLNRMRAQGCHTTKKMVVIQKQRFLCNVGTMQLLGSTLPSDVELVQRLGGREIADCRRHKVVDSNKYDCVSLWVVINTYRVLYDPVFDQRSPNKPLPSPF